FNGTLILVSHDIDFLRPIVTKVVDIRKGNLKTYLGGIDYFMEKREYAAFDRDDTVKTKKDKNELTVTNRKDQKRIEAELRQQKHQATKEIVKEISKVESLIETYENKIKELERKLADPVIYSKGETAKETTKYFNQTKSDLEFAMKKWEELNEKLIKIESQFT
ncbi:MAG: ABC transporter ATP-binding protein, partial [Ignavibacteriaceae bacterium]